MNIDKFKEQFNKLSYQEQEAVRKTAGYKIFFKQFKVKLPVYELRSEADINKFGSFTTGFRSIDNQMARREEWVYRRIVQLAELYQRRVPIIFYNARETTKEIHDIIQTHIRDIQRYLDESERGMMTGIKDKMANTLKDLRILDDFGEGIYKQAQGLIPSDGFKTPDPFNPGGRFVIGDREDVRTQVNERKYKRVTDRIDYTRIRNKKW